MSKEQSTKDLAQDLGIEMSVEQEISSIERPLLTIVMILCGFLLRQGQENEELKVST